MMILCYCWNFPIIDGDFDVWMLTRDVGFEKGWE